MIATRNDPSVLLRCPKNLLEAVDSAAAKGGRSRNTEILVRLSQSLGLTQSEPANDGTVAPQAAQG